MLFPPLLYWSSLDYFSLSRGSGTLYPPHTLLCGTRRGILLLYLWTEKSYHRCFDAFSNSSYSLKVRCFVNRFSWLNLSTVNNTDLCLEFVSFLVSLNLSFVTFASVDTF